MSDLVQIDDLSSEIMKQLQQYTEEVKEKVELAKDEAGKEAVKTLKQTSPKLTGSYARGWRLKKTTFGHIVHNATDYQLTHLLEYGHVNRDGSRTKAYPHIRKVEEKVIDEFTTKVEGAIKS